MLAAYFLSIPEVCGTRLQSPLHRGSECKGEGAFVQWWGVWALVAYWGGVALDGGFVFPV